MGVKESGGVVGFRVASVSPQKKGYVQCLVHGHLGHDSGRDHHCAAQHGQGRLQGNRQHIRSERLRDRMTLGKRKTN